MDRAVPRRNDRARRDGLPLHRRRVRWGAALSLLEVEGLTVGVAGSEAHLLRDVAFSVGEGEILGLVGESGSGKTMASLAIMGLLPRAIELRRGSVRAAGRELVDPATGRVERRAQEMAMIFQQPGSALNPTMRVGNQISRVLVVNQRLSRGEAMEKAIAMLGHVGIPGTRRVARAYPHQLSGGMCQRVMIAMALACRPRVLIADEPTTALDVTVQAQIFDLIRELAAETRCGVVLITHDLAVVAEMCDSVAVLYGGQVMEVGTTVDVLENPSHPYTRFLLDAIEREVGPRVDERGVNFALAGCRFGHRCPHAYRACGAFPPMVQIRPGHAASCFLLQDEPSHAVARAD